MKLLVEEQSAQLKNVITESKNNGSKKYYIEGIMLQCDVKNGNGRIYERKVMESALNKYMPLVEKKRALGEMQHPNSPQVSLERASHIIEKLEWRDNNVWGRARIMTEMPMGKIAKTLIDEGVAFGVSSRGLGSLVEKNGIKYVQPDFTMSAIDLVGEPSAPDAWVQGIMESAEWIYNASTDSWVMAEQFKEKYKLMKVAQINEAKLKDFEQFLNSLK